MKTSISERIRLQRLQRGYSQENMADLLNLSTTAYGDIERGKTDLTLSRLTQIAQVLNVSPVVLLTDEVVATQAVEVQPVERSVNPLAEHELETLRLTVEKQQVEIEKLRLEVENYKRKYEDRIAFELARALGIEQSRQRIGF